MRLGAYGSVKAEEEEAALPQSDRSTQLHDRAFSLRAVLFLNLGAAVAGAVLVALVGGVWSRSAQEPSISRPPAAMSLPFQVPNATQASIVGSDQWRLDNCPWGKVELGRGAWPLLHSLAAEYPDEPTQELQVLASTFIEALSQLYPCHLCARHFRASISISPPRVASRQSLSEWFCEQHNEVNARQHKPLFDCSIASLDLRWKTGLDTCWDKDHPFQEPGTE